MCTFTVGALVRHVHTVGALVRHVHIHCGGISKACAHSLWGISKACAHCGGISKACAHSLWGH